MSKTLPQKYKEWSAHNNSQEWNDDIIKSFRAFVRKNLTSINESIEEGSDKTLLDAILQVRFKTCDQKVDLMQSMIKEGAQLDKAAIVSYLRGMKDEPIDCVLKIINVLIQNGADTNAKDRIFRRTALDEAISLHKYEVAKHLIDNGADVRGLLKEACYSGSIDTVKLLLEKGADANDHNGYPMLSYALTSEKDKEAKVRAILPYTNLQNLKRVHKQTKGLFKEVVNKNPIVLRLIEERMFFIISISLLLL